MNQNWFDTFVQRAYHCLSECNMRSKTVATSQYPSFDRHRPLRRALSLLLLIFVICGTTIEAAHRHGRIINDGSSELSASFSQTSGSSNVPGGQLGCDECALCQLHKNFAAALITARTASSPLNALSEPLHSTPPAFKSQASAPQKGRAPPFTS